MISYFAVPLEELTYGLELLDGYKQIIRVIPLKGISSPDGISELAAGGNLAIRAEFPEDPVEDATYVKVVISENDLRWGLNGQRKAID